MSWFTGLSISADGVLAIGGDGQSVKRSLQGSHRALCSAPRGDPSQTNLEGLEFYWE